MEEWSTCRRDCSTREGQLEWLQLCISSAWFKYILTLTFFLATSNFLKMLVEKKLKCQQCCSFRFVSKISSYSHFFLQSWASALASDMVLSRDLLLITPAFHMIIQPALCRIIVEVFWCIRAAMSEWRMNGRVYIYLCYSKLKWCLLQHSGVYWCSSRAPHC